MSVRAGRAALLLVVVLHLVADTSLSPFYPQVFRELYGITDLSATGAYVWTCRVAAAAALPLWGLAARRWPLHRLVVVGLVASAVLDLWLGFAPTYAAFTALSAALVAATTSLALAYPAFVALGEDGDRPRQVTVFAAVTYGATVAATLAGAAVMALPDIRYGIASFAVLDLLLALYCHRVLAAPAPGPVVAAPVVTRRLGDILARHADQVRAIAGLAVIVLVAEVGRSVVRPFFTAYVETGGIAPFAGALLFLLPCLVALAVLPAAEWVRRRLRRALLPVAFAGGAAGLALQAAGPRWWLLAAGGALFGAALGLGQIALDLRIFGAVGTRGPAFALLGTVRAVALIISPVAAAATAEIALPGPLLLGAALLAVLGVLLGFGGRRAAAVRVPAPRSQREEERVLDPVH